MRIDKETIGILLQFDEFFIRNISRLDKSLLNGNNVLLIPGEGPELLKEKEKMNWHVLAMSQHHFLRNFC
ncbi:U6 snRNA-associated Sm-like protein LSm5 [Heterocephalus glaber]|uniref:U6 snRNA-associated Sm-like protein LSm5 n=1 Tax=Heterocephalus glaber TaxID=10181 RepID=A0AAX6SCY4_HETGA|nr:U6 snRNA-associated Sm-like protein LSm5 [Heterocephalus glaber]